MNKSGNHCLTMACFSLCALFIFLLLLSTNQLSANNYIQEQTLTLHMNNRTFKEVFTQIEKNSEFMFVYSGTLRDLTKKVNIDVQNQPLRDVLNELLSGTDMEYIVKGRQIIVREKEKEEIAVMVPGIQQEKKITVRGTVKDLLGYPLVGVNIWDEAGGKGSITDINGNFEIRDVDLDAILAFSYVGYTTQQIVLNKRTNLSVVLREDNELLDEVVVVGYGIQRKSSLTAAVTTIDTKQLTNIPNPNVITSLQGRVAGLTVNEWSGEPGTSPGMLLRGVGSIDEENSNPLIVVDGIPGGAKLENIPAYDIESMSFLKDAAATSIYGARASNGVILVTTKRGITGSQKPMVEFSSNAGFQTLATFPETISAYEYASLLNEAAVTDGNNPVFDDHDMEMYRTGQIDDLHGGGTNWKKMVIKDVAPVFTNHIGVSGNGNIGRYYFSGEYVNQSGMVKKIDKYDRLNLRANITSDISNNIQLQFSTNYTRTHKTASTLHNLFAQTARIQPIAQPFYEDGNYGSMIFARGSYLADIMNPVYFIDSYGDKQNNWNNLVSSVNVAYKPIKDLVLNAMGSYNLTYSDNQNYSPSGISWNPITSSVSQSSPSTLRETWDKAVKYDLQLTGTYEKIFRKHYLKLLLGFSLESFRSDQLYGYRSHFITDSLYEINAGDESTSVNSGTASHWAFVSSFGRINYAFADKYLFEASYRYDGSSRFAPGHQWGFFPSGSVAWNINKEGFMQNLDMLDQLKLRASIGQVGNAEKVGLYLWYAGINSGGYYNFDGTLVTGTRPGTFANTQLTWETTTTYNIGLDGSLWNGKLNFEVDFWRKNTNDILLTTPVSTIIGIDKSQETVNAGKVASHGFDLSIGSRGHITRDLSYNVRFSLTGWNSWIRDLKDRATQFGSLRPGEDLGNLYGYECLGIINDEETLALYKTLEGVDANHVKLGDLQYKDQNGDGKIDYKDMVKIGNSYTKNTYGLNIDLGYKDFDLQVFFQGAFNVNKLISGEVKQTFVNYRSPLGNHLNRWTEENRNANADYPRIRKDRSHNWESSDFWVRNGAYLKMKNLQIGYNVPRAFLSKIHIHNLRVYVSGTNLFTIAPDVIKGFDPQMDMQEFVYPQLRTYSVGLNINF